MTWKVKAGIVAGVILVLGILLFIIKTQQDSIAQLKAVQSEMVGMKQLADGTARSQSGYASKSDIERIIKESGLDLSVIQNDIKEINYDLKGVQRVVASTKATTGSDLPSTSVDKDKNPKPVTTVECSNGETVTCPDEFGYKADRQKFDLKEGGTIPVAQVGFSAWKKNPWDYNIYSRDYSVTTVVSTNDAGKHVFYNKFTIKSDGKEYTVPITSSNFVETFPESKFRFTPRLYFGADIGVILSTTPVQPASVFELTPNMQVAFFSYGKTAVDVDWTFVGLGLGYETQNQQLSFLLSPVNFNIGKPIPLIENLFLGPTLSLDIKGNYGLMLGLKVGL